MNPLFLIVEDEPITARFIREVIEEQGYGVAGIAKNAAEARQLCAVYPIDVVLMDINIQGSEDGIQLARNLVNYNTAIIYISAYSDKQTLNEAADTLPHGFLSKPFKEADLIAMLVMTVSRLKNEGVKTEKTGEPTEQFGAYRLDIKHNQLRHNEYKIPLSKNEMRTLELFFSKPESIITMDELRLVVWENKGVGDSTIRELINRIRNKAGGLCLENIYGVGYILKK